MTAERIVAYHFPTAEQAREFERRVQLIFEGIVGHKDDPERLKGDGHCPACNGTGLVNGRPEGI
jgi:hypothetical protein